MTKIEKNNDMIDHIGIVYVKNDIEFLRPIRLDATCDEK